MTITFDWKSVLGAIAPTVATALGGPLAGAAVSAIAGVLGIEATPEKIEAAVRNGQLTPEHIAKLRELEMQYQADEKERGFRYAELEFKDRDSARAREVGTKDNTNRILAYSIVGAFLAVIGATLLGWAQVDSALAGTLVGYISAKAEQVLAYYFGSTSGSARKTELLARGDK